MSEIHRVTFVRRDCACRRSRGIGVGNFSFCNYIHFCKHRFIRSSTASTALRIIRHWLSPHAATASYLTTDPSILRHIIQDCGDLDSNTFFVNANIEPP